MFLIFPESKLSVNLSSLNLLVRGAIRDSVDTVVLRAVIGVWIWGAALNRELLAIPLVLFLLPETRGIAIEKAGVPENRRA